KINLYEKLNGSKIIGVFKEGEFDFSAFPFINQQAANFFTVSSRFDSSSQNITNLSPGLNQGEQLVIILEYKDDLGTTQYSRITSIPITDEPIRYHNGKVNMDWFSSIESILSIISSAEPTEDSD